MTDSPPALSIDHHQQYPMIIDEDEEEEPLDERILKVIQSCPNHTIRPAKLASELGMSVNDACAELCALLSAVGSTASFRFEVITPLEGLSQPGATNTAQVPVMVFSFPPNFARLARRSQRTENFKDGIYRVLQVMFKLLKIVTAFGLILSLMILSVAAMIGLIAALVAMSRGGGGSQARSNIMRQLRSLFYTMRQLLWCYAMFGANIEGQDPFLREIAQDLSLWISICCGSPGSLWFWMRASQLHRRRQVRRRRTFARNTSTNRIQGSMEGVALVQPGTWGREQEARTNDDSATANHYRGLLSVAVEFLFGPTPFAPSPTEAEKWKLREAIILQLSSASNDFSVSLDDLAPYTDAPPSSLEARHKIAIAGLVLVAHFNGVPAASAENGQARFVFPELLAETSSSTANYDQKPDSDDGSLEYLLYAQEITVISRPGATGLSKAELPSSLQESRYVLTKLLPKQFLHCVVLGALNYIGTITLRQSLEPGGVLDMHQMKGNIIASAIQKGLMPVMHFYAILFFVLPTGRFALIVILNALRGRRNRARADLAHALKARST